MQALPEFLCRDQTRQPVQGQDPCLCGQPVWSGVFSAGVAGRSPEVASCIFPVLCGGRWPADSRECVQVSFRGLQVVCGSLK